MTRKDAIEAIKCNWPDSRYTILREALDMAVKALEDVTDKNVGKMTNADRIRSMSDKELVRIRYRGAPHCKSDDPMKCNRHDFLDGMSPCELCYYEWLQQPVEEDDHA